MIRNQSLVAVTIASLAALFLVSGAQAQDRVPIYPVPFRAAIGLNPLGIPFDVGAIEVEGVILPGVTLAGAASYSALGDDDGDGEGDPRFASGDVKVRYYPGEVALRGFSVGLGLGITRYSENRATGPGGVFEREAMTAPTISVLADYNFLLGARQRFLVGTGIGAKRILAAEEDRDRTGAPQAYPFVRFILGLAF